MSAPASEPAGPEERSPQRAGGSGGFIRTVTDAEMRREKDKARQLRATAWWRRRLAQGRCDYCGRPTPPRDLDLRGGKESTLVVEVTDPAGNPMDGAAIALETESGFLWNTQRQTGADGRATLDRLIAGRVIVRAERGNRVGQALVEVTPGASLRAALVIR